MIHENDIQGPPLYDLILFRTGETFRHPRGAQGIRGQLIVNPRSPMSFTCHTLERGDGRKHLPEGEYQCEFGYWTTKKGLRIKAIRVLGAYSVGRHEESRGRIYLHPANWPHQLEGCIAVGLSTTPNGIKGSTAALLSVFDHLGGWTNHESAGPPGTIEPLRLLVRLPTASERARLSA